KVEKLLDLPARLAAKRAGGVEILKVAHHGSKFSTSEEFLRKIKPKLAIISVGKNRFGHPTPEVLERLNQAGVKVLRTDQEGNIEIVSNGWGWYNSP
ncbi:competence protein ComEC, partial [Candidatus Shapirobacteria bacterium CG_4_9_14_3_um_filter_39_13]